MILEGQIVSKFLTKQTKNQNLSIPYDKCHFNKLTNSTFNKCPLNLDHLSCNTACPNKSLTIFARNVNDYKRDFSRCII